MVSIAIPSQVCSQVGTRESIERKPWTAEARNDVLGVLGKSLGLVCAAIFLYSLGPALGMTLLAVSLAVWSLLGSQIASEEEKASDEICGYEETRGYVTTLNAASRCADPAWMRSGRFGTPAAPASRAVQRHGA